MTGAPIIQVPTGGLTQSGHRNTDFLATLGGQLGRNCSSKHVPRSFNILPFPSIKCRVHPVVVFTILDAYIRREEDQDYVIGTLMGIVSEGSMVDVTDCFVDRHSLTDAGLLQIIKDHHESMYELKQRVNPKEQVVGWFCTGAEMTELTCAVHGWFKSFSSVSKFQAHAPLVEPIHLIVDTTLADGHLMIKAFLQVPTLIVKDACFHFQEIPMEIQTSQAELAGMSILLKAKEAQKLPKLGTRPGPPGMKDSFESSLDQLSSLLVSCNNYVTGVLSGEKPRNAHVGRFLLGALSAETVLDSDKFEHICQTSLQDSLMVTYLATLARLQFAVAEKLNTSFF